MMKYVRQQWSAKTFALSAVAELAISKKDSPLLANFMFKSRPQSSVINWSPIATKYIRQPGTVV